VHVCIINVAISRLGWTLMKDITSQHELSFTTQWENTIMYLEPHADIELSRKWPIICRYVLPDRLRFHIGIHSSRSMPSFLPDCKSLEQHCFGYVKAICVQHAIDLLLPSQSIRLETRPRLLPRHPAHSSSTPTAYGRSHVRGKPIPTCLSRQTCIAYMYRRPMHIKGSV
jgi:hypothetical protein